jgi:hypothetical protein
MRTVLGLVTESVEGLVELSAIAARANRDQRQKPGVLRSVKTDRRIHEGPHLGQRVVQDVGQAVTVLDQVLDSVDPAAAFTT